MEIKRVKEESYESISKYLDLLLTCVPVLFEVCMINYNGKQYMLGFSNDVLGIVENDGKYLNTYKYYYDNSEMVKYSTEQYDYQIIFTDDIRDITKTDLLNGNMERLSFLGRIENFPRDILEYVQFNHDEVATMQMKYDVTSRNGVTSSLNYSKFHKPDILELDILKKFLLYYKKKYIYVMGLNNEGYYSPLIHIGDLLIGNKKKVFDPDLLLEEMSKFGFNKSIPDDLSSILSDNSRELNTIKTLSNSYFDYIKGQKKQ